MTRGDPGHTPTRPVRACPRTPIDQPRLPVARREGAIRVAVDVLSPAPPAAVTPVAADLPFPSDAVATGFRRPAVRRATLAATAAAGALAVLILCFTPLVDADSVGNGARSASDGLQVLVAS